MKKRKAKPNQPESQSGAKPNQPRSQTKPARKPARSQTKPKASQEPNQTSQKASQKPSQTSQKASQKPARSQAKPTRSQAKPRRTRSNAGRTSARSLSGRIESIWETPSKERGAMFCVRAIRWRLGTPARHPAAPARHRSHLPGIEASSLPSPRFFHQGRNSDFALHRGRNSDFAFFARKTHHRASAGGPSARLSLRVPLTECFFTIHTPSRQSWRGHRIARLNPGVGTGLLHSLAWAQDCFTQSWRGHSPGVSLKTLHSDALPDSPPGLPGKLSALLYSSALTDSPLPGFKFGKYREDQAASYDRV